MLTLTDRQRFALRESLCDVLSDYSEEWSATSWDQCSVNGVRRMISSTGADEGWSRRLKQLVGLVELLGEWPVGYRGEGGWEKIEL